MWGVGDGSVSEAAKSIIPDFPILPAMADPERIGLGRLWVTQYYNERTKAPGQKAVSARVLFEFSYYL